MRIVLFCSAFNGLSQRVWIDLTASGHDVTIHLAADRTPIELTCRTLNPDLIICPFLKDRVPESVWRRYRTIIIHPGPMGDRGPSSLDWAIADRSDRWGVTALQAVDEMDAGPIWATRDVPMPADPVRKSALYSGPVADAAVELVAEVVSKATDPGFRPRPLDYGEPDVTGRLRPTMTQNDRGFSWADPASEILRKIQAADGAPGVRTELAGQAVSVFDAHEGPAYRRPVYRGPVADGPPLDARPGEILGSRQGSVLVATGDGSLWIGQARRRNTDGQAGLKLPAAMVLGQQLRTAATVLGGAGHLLAYGRDDAVYHREGTVGVISFDFYNGAMSTAQCRRLTAAVRRAATHDTKVLVLRGGESFSNGIHLNVIEAAESPAAEAWANINAIDDLCQAILTCTDQLVVASIGSNAGAGGVMLALGADRIHLREAAVLNPHYATMGLYGSEYWTYVLPRRIGTADAERLTTACLPIGAGEAAGIGLVDQVSGGDRAQFEQAVLADAQAMAADPGFDRALRRKRDHRERDEARKPLAAYRSEELGQMSRDMFDDRSAFNEARRAFVFKQTPDQTPSHLRAA